MSITATEYLMIGTTITITLVIGILIGIQLGKKNKKETMQTDDFIYKYYAWYKTNADKGHSIDKLKLELKRIGNKKQAQAVHKYYIKEKKQRLKDEIKYYKKEAIKKKYLDSLNDAILK